MRVRESKHLLWKSRYMDELGELNVALVARESRINDFSVFIREKLFHI